jgi:hypothetical protein
MEFSKGIAMDHQQQIEAKQHSSRSKWVLIGFLIVAAFFLWSEHRAHFLGVLPYLLVLACPLMHLFHHGHHRHHGNHGASETSNARQDANRIGEKP